MVGLESFNELTSDAVLGPPSLDYLASNKVTGGSCCCQLSLRTKTPNGTFTYSLHADKKTAKTKIQCHRIGARFKTEKLVFVITLN